MAKNHKDGNEIQRQKRRDLVEAMLLDGSTRAQIVAAVCPRFDVSDRTVDNDIALAYRQWESHFSDRSRRRLFLHLRRLDDLYRRCLTKDDLRTALAVVGESANLDGTRARGASLEGDPDAETLMAIMDELNATPAGLRGDLERQREGANRE